MTVENYDEDVRGPLYQYLFTEKHPSKKLDRAKELLSEKFNYVKDAIGNNKRLTAYAVATIGSAIALGSLASLAGAPLEYRLLYAADGAVVSGAISLIHDTLEDAKKHPINF